MLLFRSKNVVVVMNVHAGAAYAKYADIRIYKKGIMGREVGAMVSSESAIAGEAMPWT